MRTDGIFKQVADFFQNVVDVDGSYLYKKQQALSQAYVRMAPLPPPSTPVSGWHTISEADVASIAANIPVSLQVPS